MNLLRLTVQKAADKLLRPQNHQSKFSSLCSASKLFLSNPQNSTNSDGAGLAMNCTERTKSALLLSHSNKTSLNNQVREYKMKTRLRKRCKSCYFMWRNGRLYVECEENPRHKQHHMSSMLKGFDSVSHGYDIKAEKAEKEAQAAWKAAIL